jgi:hypothetical protein
MAKRKTYKWTEEQKKFLMEKPPNITWGAYTEVMNTTFKVKRNTSSVYAKFKMLSKANAPKETEKTERKLKQTQPQPDIKKPKKEYRFARTRRRWTPQEELEVLVNFYSLSVDEAREKWERPYSAIAGRLEKICDMTEPHHESLLIEATKIVKQKEAMMRRPSRKERRAAKRAAKIAKKQERLAEKIRRMRGE